MLKSYTTFYFKTTKLFRLGDKHDDQFSIIMYKTINYGSYECIKSRLVNRVDTTLSEGEGEALSLTCSYVSRI